MPQLIKCKRPAAEIEPGWAGNGGISDVVCAVQLSMDVLFLTIGIWLAFGWIFEHCWNIVMVCCNIVVVLFNIVVTVACLSADV